MPVRSIKIFGGIFDGTVLNTQMDQEINTVQHVTLYMLDVEERYVFAKTAEGEDVLVCPGVKRMIPDA